MAGTSCSDHLPNETNHSLLLTIMALPIINILLGAGALAIAILTWMAPIV